VELIAAVAEKWLGWVDAWLKRLEDARQVKDVRGRAN
jgi:hypothetical protein